MFSGGCIIFNSSIGAYLTGQEIAAYGLSKTAQLALVRALSESLAPKGIRVNSVVPSTIRADFSRLMWDSKHPHFGKATSAAEGVRSLLGRIGEPSEVAGAVAYLASDDASFVSGLFFSIGRPSSPLSGENHLVVGGVDCRL